MPSDDVADLEVGPMVLGHMDIAYIDRHHTYDRYIPMDSSIQRIVH